MLVRVYDLERKKAIDERAELRSLAQGTGDRSDKIRTYNFPQDRVTDHRIGFSLNGVERVLSGESVEGILDALGVADEEERVRGFLETLENSFGEGGVGKTNKAKQSNKTKK